MRRSIDANVISQKFEFAGRLTVAMDGLLCICLWADPFSPVVVMIELWAMSNSAQVSFTLPIATSTPHAFHRTSYGGGGQFSSHRGGLHHSVNTTRSSSGGGGGGGGGANGLQPVQLSLTGEDMRSHLSFANGGEGGVSTTSGLIGDSIKAFFTAVIPVAVHSAGAIKNRLLTLTLSHCLPPEAPHNTLDRILQLQLTDEVRACGLVWSDDAEVVVVC